MSGVRSPEPGVTSRATGSGRGMQTGWRTGFRALRRELLRGFSLIEIMVVVGLLSVIVLGLMAMFGQTQRAFQLGMSQTDVLESGRLATEMLTRELGQITPSYFNRTNASQNNGTAYGSYDTPNFAVAVADAYRQALPAADTSRTNIMQDVFFLIRNNQTWTGIGYFVRTNYLLTNNNVVLPLPGGVGPVGSLYRFEASDTQFQFQRNPAGMFAAFSDALYRPQLYTNNISKIIDGVTDFQVRPLDMDGWALTNNPAYYTNLPASLKNLPAAMTASNLVVTPLPGNSPYYWCGENGLCEFYSNAVPASVELQLGILESQTLRQYESIPPGQARWNFLTNSQARAIAHIHLFRRLIPVPNVDPAAYYPLSD